MRVTNLAGVDLSVFRFDYDLTWCALLMNADGTIYHTYGGRDATSASSHLSAGSFRRVLEQALADHEAYKRKPSPPEALPRVTIETMPAMARKIAAGRRPDCFHCHMVNDAVTAQARFEKRWSKPLAPGDILESLGGRHLLTFGDLQRALDATPDPAPAPIRATWRRDGRAQSATLTLPAGWRTPRPETYAWRPSKWPLSPKPGFGGRLLNATDLRRLGLPPGTFAFEVTYLVTWGENAHTGRNAARAGLRKGDVFLSAAGKRDFRSVDHFHAWFRLTRKPGTTISITILRNGRQRTLTLPVVD